ncbi:unnamed protein product, partial [Enterobius vermicularis]|uniref:C3H1-type domain-containing protein n=1 Tax=Enterobius vermicularis TaxID=51028 RepID=A0A0N4V2U3_ENTVE
DGILKYVDLPFSLSVYNVPVFVQQQGTVFHVLIFGGLKCFPSKLFLVDFRAAIIVVILEVRKCSAYKTSLCKTFKETGSCDSGPSCHYAHGEQELRSPPKAHPKYKTQLCKSFAEFGTCPYGSRFTLQCFVYGRLRDLSGDCSSAASRPCSSVSEMVDVASSFSALSHLIPH